MKKKTILFISILYCAGLQAQSVDDAKNLLYYKKFDSAIKTLAELVKTNPDNGEGWLLLTSALVLNNDTKEAVESLKRAPQSLSEDPYFLTAKGLTQLQMNHRDSAKYFFNTAMDKVKGKDPGVPG